MAPGCQRRIALLAKGSAIETECRDVIILLIVKLGASSRLEVLSERRKTIQL